MLFKSCPAKVKAAGKADGLEEGQFEALVSVFDNIDSYGDLIIKGAFADTLAAWAAKGDPIPVYYSHRMDNPDFLIGEVLEAKETDEGLWVKAQLHIEDDEDRTARKVHRSMTKRLLTQFSFAYDIDEAGFVTNEDEEYLELRRLTLHEVGPTPIGANSETELIGVKTAAEQVDRLARAVKSGRMDAAVLQQAKTSLDAATQQLTDVLSALGGEAGNDGKATAGKPAKDEAADGKSEEPTCPSHAELSALLSIELADAS